MTTSEKVKQKRGFALMDPEKRRELASKGGIAAQTPDEDGRVLAHQFTSEEASEAGKKGAAVVKERYGVEHYAEIGRLGGRKRGENAKKKLQS